MSSPSSPARLWPQPPSSPSSLPSLSSQTPSPHSLQGVPLAQTPWLPIWTGERPRRPFSVASCLIIQPLTASLPTTLPSAPLTWKTFPYPSAQPGRFILQVPTQTPLHLPRTSVRPFFTQHLVNSSIFQFPPQLLICI